MLTPLSDSKKDRRRRIILMAGVKVTNMTNRVISLLLSKTDASYIPG
jgi:hypothetical protein